MNFHPSIKALIILVVCSMSMVTYTYLIPPVLSLESYQSLPILGSLEGDYPLYWGRYILAFTLMGLVPLLLCLALGFKLKDLGLCLPQNLSWKWIGAGALLFTIIGALSAFDPPLAAYYPYSKSLLSSYQSHGISILLFHSATYLLLYYLPWEIFFRGILVFPFFAEGAEQEQNNFRIALFQAIPSTLLHFGHPFTETFSAIFFGVFSAWLVWRTRSIVAPLIFHACVGISLDISIILLYS